MLRAATVSRVSFICTWLVPLCLLFCGSMVAGEQTARCHRSKPSHCPNQISPARCAAVDYDIPKSPPLVATLPQRISGELPEIEPGPVPGMQVEQTRDRLALHRVLRI
ncbi:MAG: hypothetical protein JNL62_04970 [Bryobacterales bacterium]|nr:hypothetical protein [Bryobacterales bacterium]